MADNKSQHQSLDAIFDGRDSYELSWGEVLAQLRSAKAVVKSHNGELLISIAGRHLLVPRRGNPFVTEAQFVFIRQALTAQTAWNSHKPEQDSGGDTLRLVAAVDNVTTRVFRVLTAPPEVAGFVALEPYEPHVYECYPITPGTTADVESLYFEQISVALAPARQILLVERGVSSTGQRLLRFLRKYHLPIAARLAGGTVFGAPGGTDRALLALARRHLGVS